MGPVLVQDRQIEGQRPSFSIQNGGVHFMYPTIFFMAALTLSEIPSNINTYERLLVWAAQCCQSISNGTQVSVITNAAAVPQAQVQVAVTADNVDRFIVTAYVACDVDALNDANNKTWMAAEDIGQNQPNTNLLSN